MESTQQREYEKNKVYRFKEYYESISGTDMYLLDELLGKSIDKELKKILNRSESVEILVIWPDSGKLEIPVLKVICNRLPGLSFKITLVEPNPELSGQFEEHLKNNSSCSIEKLEGIEKLKEVEGVESRFHIILTFSAFPYVNAQLNLINDLDNCLVDGGLIFWAENNGWLRAVDGSIDYRNGSTLVEKWREFWEKFHDRVYEIGKLNINPIKESDHSLVEFIYINNGYQKIFQEEISINLKEGTSPDGLTIKNWFENRNWRYVNPSLTDGEYEENISQDSVNALAEALDEALNKEGTVPDKIQIFSFKKQVAKYSRGTRRDRILDNLELKSLISYQFHNNILLRLLRKEETSSSRLFEELNIGTKFHSAYYEKIVLKRRLYVLTKYLFKLIGKMIHIDYALWASPAGDYRRESTPRSLPVSFLCGKGKEYEKTYLEWYVFYFLSRECLNIGETFGNFLFRNMPDYESIVIKKRSNHGQNRNPGIKLNINENILEIEQIGTETNGIFPGEESEIQIIKELGSKFNSSADGLYQFDRIFKILREKKQTLIELSERITGLYEDWHQQVRNNHEEIEKLKTILMEFRRKFNPSARVKESEITNLTDEFLKNIFTTNFINSGEWGSIRFKINSMFKKEKEQTYDGFLLMANVNSPDLENKEIRIIDCLIDDAAAQFTAKDAVYISYSLSKREVSLNALKTAIAAIMSRNMSHNIGSHVIADLVAKEPNASRDDVNSLYRYLQNRMDFIAQITAEIPQWTYPAQFHKGIMRIFFENFLLIDRIGISEGLKAYDWSKGGEEGESVDKIIIRTGISRRHLPEKEDNFKWVISECQDEENQDKEIEKDLQLAIPGGILGYHAFYIIIENIIRNSAKHGYAGNRPRLSDPGSSLGVKVRIDDMVDKDYAWITIWDNIQQGANRVFNLDVEKENREVSGDITQDEIEERLNITGDINLFGSSNDRFRRPFIKPSGDLVKENWGLAELKICAGYLQNRQPEEIGDYRGKIIDYGTDCFDLKKEFTIVDPENPNKGYPAMVIKAIPVNKLGDEIQELKKDETYFLGYRFWMKKPKIVAIIGDIQNGSHGINVGPVSIRDVNSLEELRKYGIYHLGQDLDELIANKQPLDYEFLVIDARYGGIFLEAIRRIQQPRGRLSYKLKQTLLEEFGVEQIRNQDEQIFKWMSRVIERLPARIIIIELNSVEDNWNFPVNGIQHWIRKRIVWTKELERVNIRLKEGDESDYKALLEVNQPGNNLEPQQLPLVLYNTWIQNHYWKGEFEVDINFVGDSETADITYDFIRENIWEIKYKLQKLANVDLEDENLFLPFYCPEDAMPGNINWKIKCGEFLDKVTLDGETAENKARGVINQKAFLYSCSYIIHKRQGLPGESHIKEVLYEIFNKKNNIKDSVSKVPAIFKNGLPKDEGKNKFIIKQTQNPDNDDIAVKLKYSRHEIPDPGKIMEDKKDDSMYKYFYQESLTGAAPHFNLLYTTFSTGNSSNEGEKAEMYFNLVENGLMRMLIADERISNYVEKNQKMKDTFLCAGISIIEDLEEVIANGTDDNKDFFNYGELEQFQTIRDNARERRFDLFIIHQGIIDKMKLQPGEIENLVNDWKRNYFSFVIVTSGRGTPSNVPINTRFLPFSILESNFITPAISKLIALKSAYKSLARRY